MACVGSSAKMPITSNKSLGKDNRTARGRSTMSPTVRPEMRSSDDVMGAMLRDLETTAARPVHHHTRCITMARTIAQVENREAAWDRSCWGNILSINDRWRNRWTGLACASQQLSYKAPLVQFDEWCPCLRRTSATTIGQYDHDRRTVSRACAPLRRANCEAAYFSTLRKRPTRLLRHRRAPSG